MDYLDYASLIALVLDKKVYVHNFNCPLHYCVQSEFLHLLKEKGFKNAPHEELLVDIENRDFVKVDTNLSGYGIGIFTTMTLEQIESFYSVAIKRKYMNQYVHIHENMCQMSNKLGEVTYEEIIDSLPSYAINILDKSLWGYEDFCNKYKSYNFTNTLEIMLYGPPGIGKTFLLRSYLNRLIQERNFTVIQIYPDALNNVNFSLLLESCKHLFPCILFIEDIDLYFKDRKVIGPKNLTGAMLQTFDGLSKVDNVVLIATTNNVDIVEKALLRPGRIDYAIQMKRPVKKNIEKLLDKYIGDLDFEFPDTLKTVLVDNVETYAELNGAYQHIVRSYLSDSSFPKETEIIKLISQWKDTRSNSFFDDKNSKVGF